MDELEAIRSHSVAAASLVNEKDHDKAVAMFDQAIEQLERLVRERPAIMGAPNSEPADQNSGYYLLGMAYSWKGHALAQLGRPGEARRCADKAAECAAGSYEVQQLRAKAYAGCKMLDEAREAIGRAILLSPKLYRLYITKSEILRQAGDLDGALASVRAAGDLAPVVADIYHIETVILSDMEDYRGALAANESVLGLDPESAEAHRSKAILQARLKNYGAAISSLEAAARFDPDNPLNITVRNHIANAMTAGRQQGPGGE